MESCLHRYHSHPVGVTLGGLLSTLTWPGEHEKGLLTSPPFGWRAGASDWIASSSCIFCVNTYSGKYLSALFLSMWRSVLHRGATQNPVPHIFLPSSQAADAELGSHDYIFSNDFLRLHLATLPAQGCWTNSPRAPTGRERQQWEEAAAQQRAVWEM